MALYRYANVPTLKEKRDNQSLAFIITYMMFGIFLNNLANIYMAALSLPLGFVSTLNKALIFGLLVLNIWNLFKRINLISLIFYFFLFFVLGFNFILQEPGSGFMELMSTFVTTVLPVIVVMFCMTEYESLLKQLTVVAKVIVLLSVTVLFVSGEEMDSYYMGFSNALVPPILFLLNEFFTNRKKTSLLLAIIGTIVIIAIGSRGSLIGIAVFFIIQLFHGVASPKTFTRSALSLAAIALVYFNFTRILRLANRALLSFGISSRTILLLLSDEIGTSGRDIIYKTVGEAFLNEPLTIHGIGSEYLLVDKYPHNLMLELLYQFGLFIGGTALLCIVYLTIRTVFNKNATTYEKVRLILFSSSVPLLMISASFWIVPYFWMWIVMCINRKSERTAITGA